MWSSLIVHSTIQSTYYGTMCGSYRVVMGWLLAFLWCLNGVYGVTVWLLLGVMGWLYGGYGCYGVVISDVGYFMIRVWLHKTFQ